MTPKEKKILKNVEKASKIVLKEDAKLFKELHKKDSEPKSVNLRKHWMCQKCGFEIKHSNKPICCSCGGKNSFVELEEPPSHSEKQMDKFTERLITPLEIKPLASTESRTGFNFVNKDKTPETLTPQEQENCSVFIEAAALLTSEGIKQVCNFDSTPQEQGLKTGLAVPESRQVPLNHISEGLVENNNLDRNPSLAIPEWRLNPIKKDMTSDFLPHEMNSECFCPDCQKARDTKKLSFEIQLIDKLNFLIDHLKKQINLAELSTSNLWNMAYDEGYQDGEQKRKHKERMEEGEKWQIED